MTTPTPTGSSRLERAARALLDLVEAMRVPQTMAEAALQAKTWLPVMDELRAALAEAEAGRAGTVSESRCTRCGKPVTLMQSQLPDEAGLPCHKNCPPPATAAEVRAAALEEAVFGLIAAERRRQVESEGWTKEHDDEHDDQELARAAACYATPVYLRPVRKPPPEWPWDDEFWKPTQTDRVRELTKAGALIAAEIDRLLRAGPKPA